MPAKHPQAPRLWRREGEGLEFDRFAFFTDAIYAIAVTLTALELRPDNLPDDPTSEEVTTALLDLYDNILVFILLFIIIGMFWSANHQFVSTLKAVDRRLIHLNLPYLACIAFLPFPASMLVEDNGVPLTGAFFAVVMAVASLIEWVLLLHAHRAGLLRVPYDREEFRWASIDSLIPVAVFLASVPLMWVKPMHGQLTWMLIIPLEMWSGRRQASQSNNGADSTDPDPEDDAGS